MAAVKEIVLLEVVALVITVLCLEFFIIRLALLPSKNLVLLRPNESSLEMEIRVLIVFATLVEVVRLEYEWMCFDVNKLFKNRTIHVHGFRLIALPCLKILKSIDRSVLSLFLHWIVVQLRLA